MKQGPLAKGIIAQFKKLFTKILHACKITFKQTRRQKNIMDCPPAYTGAQFLKYLSPDLSKKISMHTDGDEIIIQSNLAEGEHEYVYARDEINPKALTTHPELKCFLETTNGLTISLVILFLDVNKQRIEHVNIRANRFISLKIPPQTTSLRLGLRVLSSGITTLKTITLAQQPIKNELLPHGGQHLVLTNGYPSDENLYNKSFVHSRVKSYIEADIKVDVFCLSLDEPLSLYTFDGIRIMRGNQQVLNQILCMGNYQNVLVHFLNEYMWSVLSAYVDILPMIIWVHGAEIQPMHRREYNHKSAEMRALAQRNSEKRMEFWNKILHPLAQNIHFVFVSKYFQEEVSQDLDFKFPENKISIIHNPIDTNTFSYTVKNPEQRKKILSIRSFSSFTYANDLSVKTILHLAQNSWFKELEFRIIGDGILFEETLASLYQFDNVHIERRFLRQSEIAALHKQYGIFLCPTRMDSQGVSRDEAMSSGLIPVTNCVAAIPEFTDESCAILAPAEDAISMAKGIIKLYENPDLFERMSASAAARIRQQSDSKKIIAKEIHLINQYTHTQRALS